MPGVYQVLIVEDNPDYRMILESAIQTSEFDVNVQAAGDGEEALDVLMKQQGTDGETVKWPDLVLLDLRLPKVDGLDVLETMKGTSALRRIPVVVMTTSDSGMDRDRAYDLGVNGYLTKPEKTSDVKRMMQGLLRYWLVCNKGATLS